MPTKENNRRRFLAKGLTGLLLPIGAALADTTSPATTQPVAADTVNIKDFLPPRDGKRDDSAAINKAIAYCLSKGLQHIRFPSGEYRLENTLTLFSGITYEADGPVTLRMETANVPIMESACRHKGAPRGRTAIIGDFRLMGNPKAPGNHGIVLYDYYSRIDGVSIYNCGGIGIFLAEANKAGKRPSGTLVENKITNCKLSGCMKGAICVSETPNSKVTDGLMQNLTISCASSEAAIAVASAAGWTLQNIHIYGKSAPRQAISLSNAYFTTLDNLYIEGYTECAINIAALQTSVSLHNIAIKSGSSGENQSVICVNTRDPAQNPTAFLSNISIFHRGEKKIKALQIAPQITYSSTNLLISGPGKSLVAS